MANDELRTEMQTGFKKADREFEAVRAEIKAQGEHTRTHMDVLFDKFKAESRLALDKIMAADQQIVALKGSNVVDHAAFQEVLQDHEVRIKALEPGEESART